VASLPATWSNVAEDCCDNIGNDGLPNGLVNITVVTSNVINANFGITQSLSLGNMVWKDANKNGLKDATEVGIAGAVVKLYTDNDNNGIKDGAAVDSFTTLANGLYVFNNLSAGKYIVGVVCPVPTVGNAWLSTPINEVNPNLNIDNNDNGLLTVAGETNSGVIILNAGMEPVGELPNNANSMDSNANLTVDFGFYQPITISGNVWHDVNSMTDNYVNNSGGVAVPAASQIPVGLRAYLVNPLTNLIVKSSIVPSSTGAFIFTDIAAGNNYYVIISKTPAIVGSLVPAALLPNGWSNTGEKFGITTGHDGVINGRLNVPSSLTNIVNVNFGIKAVIGEFVLQ
jgi:SdrD B-like domain